MNTSLLTTIRAIVALTSRSNVFSFRQLCSAGFEPEVLNRHIQRLMWEDLVEYRDGTRDERVFRVTERARREWANLELLQAA